MWKTKRQLNRKDLPSLDASVMNRAAFWAMYFAEWLESDAKFRKELDSTVSYIVVPIEDRELVQYSREIARIRKDRGEDVHLIYVEIKDRPSNAFPGTTSSLRIVPA